MKARSSALTLALAMLVGAAVAVFPSSVPGTPAPAQAIVGNCTPGSDWGTLRQDLTARVIDLVNQHRAARGLSQLSISTSLTDAAIWKSRHMAKYVYMAHADPAPPVARSVSDRLLACGYPALSAGWGENIAYGYASADAVMTGWLNSPGHRANIENPSYRAIGVGAASSSTGRLYWTQEFGTSTGGSTPPPSAACSNGLDDDGDGKIDYPADPGCSSTADTNEYNAPPAAAACANGLDDDGDGKIDYPADPGCSSTADTNEYNAPPAAAACANGLDDDGDGKVDYPADPGCSSTTDNDEYNAPPPPSAACSNGLDDDGDGKIDYPADPGCSSTADTNEYNAPPAAAACANGLDDDGDGKVDYPADPGCRSITDDNESDRSR